MIALGVIVALTGVSLVSALVHPEKFCRYAEKFLTMQAEER